MQQILTAWRALDTRRRLIVSAATIGVFIAILTLSGMATTPRMALLYAGLESPQAGEIVTALEQRSIRYEVRGDSIYVEAPRRDELRMTLASEGLPASGGNGYELLDSLSGFGTTSQMFDAAYSRAKEGELARTILSNQNIRAARVHIAVPNGQGFHAAAHPTASVSVTTVNGGLPQSQAKALKYLVSSAVSGMRPEDVSIIDSVSGLVATGDESPQQSGDLRAAELRKNVERLLEARVGYGNAVVEVSIQAVTQRESYTERKLDPESRVAISTETDDKKHQESNTKGDKAVSVASNLPEGDANAKGGSSQNQQNESREKNSYDVSETTREIQREPGDIRRLTVAVLVDGVEGKDAAGQSTIVPRPEDELASLRDLVASAVGFDEARGDVITVRSMAFQTVAPGGTAAPTGLFAGQGIEVTRLVEIAALVLVVLVLALFVIRPMLMQRVAMRAPEPEPAPDGPVLTGEIADSHPSDGRLMPGFGMTHVSLPDEDGPLEGDPVGRLRRLIEKRQAESVEILRDWMEKAEGRV